MVIETAWDHLKLHGVSFEIVQLGFYFSLFFRFKIFLILFPIFMNSASGRNYAEFTGFISVNIP